MNNETELRDIPRTCNGLFLWIEQKRNNHDLKPVTARDWLGSCKRLFPFDDPGWEQKDPSEMDFGLLGDRALNAGMKDITVRTYRNKAKEAIRNFMKFQENPSAYKSPVFKPKKSHDGTSEVLSLPASPTATPPAAIVHQGLSQDRHLHFHIHLTPE